MTVLEKIRNLLDVSGIEYRAVEHPPVYTSEDAARIRDTDISVGAKALVFLADGRPVLLVVPADKRADLKAFKRVFGIKDLRFATPEEVKKITSLEIGSIPPLGGVIGLPSYFDEEFTRKGQVVFNAGSHTTSIVMSAKDLISVENPTIAKIA
ncbi:hypothetical protein HYW61_01320 [candidate division WWE3 bacterium]|nr:hypothetical protein [candidate division WWE3 bacterium]